VKQDHAELNLELPASADTSDYIRSLAEKNASIYEEVFTNVPRNSMARYDSVFDGFPSGGWNEKKDAIARYIYAQPPDLQAQYMEVASTKVDEATRTVGRHNIAKALSRLKGSGAGDRVRGFWVSMPLEWGHGMDDPAAAMPVELIAARPAVQGGSSGTLQALARLDVKSPTEQT
jgi:hypothetical protein